MDVKNLIKKYQIVESTFKDLSKLNFFGVYIIYDPNNKNEVVYVGTKEFERKILS